MISLLEEEKQETSKISTEIIAGKFFSNTILIPSFHSFFLHNFSVQNAKSLLFKKE